VKPASRRTLHSRNNVTQSLRTSHMAQLSAWNGQASNWQPGSDQLGWARVPSQYCPYTGYRLALLSPAIKHLSLERYKAQKFVPSDRCGIEVRCGVGKFSGNESYCLVTGLITFFQAYRNHKEWPTPSSRLPGTFYTPSPPPPHQTHLRS
jgi:hypothetical protein